jgi:hypothetical protein
MLRTEITGEEARPQIMSAVVGASSDSPDQYTTIQKRRELEAWTSTMDVG